MSARVSILATNQVRVSISGTQGPPGSGEGTTDHGGLTGLADDDHSQYHTDARGDARYLSGAVQVTRTAGATLAARDLCVLNASSQMVLADASAEATAKGFLGIAAAAINSAASGTFIHRGSVGGFTGLTAGAVYYISTTAGGITTTPPSTTGEFVRVVGYAESSTALWFDPSAVWLEIQ